MIREFELLEALAPFLAPPGNGVLVPPGDDAAVVEVGDDTLCITVDVLVEDVHFRRSISSFRDVGWKAIAVNVSDIAAIGGRSQIAVVGLCCPRDLPLTAVTDLYAGMREACDTYGVRLVGGDTVAAEQLTVSATLVGGLPGRAVRRSGARPGDRLVLVGTLGAAAAALTLLQQEQQPPEALLAAHRRPIALARAGVILAKHGATAMIDVSDGLGTDLGHLCRASVVRARVDAAALPVHHEVDDALATAGVDRWATICGGGEDFALLAALPPASAQAAAARAGAADHVPAAVIGEVLPPGPGPAVVLHVNGEERDLTGLGYEHFRSSV